MRRFYRLPISPRYLVYAALFISFLLLAQDYASYRINGFSYAFSWFALSSRYLLTYGLWVVLAPLVYVNATLFLSGSSFATNSIKSLGLSISIALVHRLLVIVLYGVVYSIRRGEFGDLFTEQNTIAFTEGMFSSFIECWVITGFFLALNYYNYSLRINEQLRSAELHALKEQLQPHFLFNTLHAISSLIDYNKQSAQKMIIRLGDLLRSVLQGGDANLVTLQEELQYIRSYLDIEMYRFSDKLKIQIDNEEGIEQVRVPSLILQPLVENAIKHGISKREAPGTIALRCERTQNKGTTYLTMKIENDNPEKTSEKPPGFGIGLKNIRKRLEHLYEDDFQLITSFVGTKTRVNIIIPFEV